MRIVYGGASIGLMGVVGRRAIARHVDITGILPTALLHREAGLLGLTQMETVDSMIDRKARAWNLPNATCAAQGRSWKVLSPTFAAQGRSWRR